MPQFSSQEAFEQALRGEQIQTGQISPDITDLTTDDRNPTVQVSAGAELNRFQVTRKEFSCGGKFAANITISADRMQFNAACIRFYPDANYVQILIDPVGKRMAIRACREYTKDAFQWARVQKKDKKRVSREIKMTEAWTLFFTMMGWSTDHKYKIIGTRKIFTDADIVVFLLEDAVEYTTEKETLADGTVKVKRNAFLPVQWRDSFGDYVDVHDKKMEISAEETLRLFSTPDGTSYMLKPKSKGS